MHGVFAKHTESYENLIFIQARCYNLQLIKMSLSIPVQTKRSSQQTKQHPLKQQGRSTQQTNVGYSWKSIWQIALEHKKALIYSHIIAILATIASVPVPLLMPLLVDEVLLHKPGFIIAVVDPLFPVQWHVPILYISLVLLVSVVLRIIAIIFNIIQSRQFSLIAKDIVFRIRSKLIGQLQTISMSEYETLGTGTVVTHLVTDLDTVDNFIGNTISKLLVASLTILGTAVIPVMDALAVGPVHFVVKPGGDLFHPRGRLPRQGS